MFTNSAPSSSQKQKALFLDRDGVINVNHGYVFQQQSFDFMEGIFELCLKARDKGYLIIIVTNQSGIARGYYSEHEFKRLTRWIEHQFWKKGIKIQQTLHCPHHPKYSFRCCCRKPKIGMLTKASRRFGIDRSQSVMIGDSLSDMQCAQAAEVGTRIYLNQELQAIKGAKPNSKPYFQISELKQAEKLLK